MDSTLTRVLEDPWFEAAPNPRLLLDGDFRIREPNDAYVRATGQSRDLLVGAYMFDAFPDNPDDPQASGVHNLGASLEQVMRRSRVQHMWVQRYDVIDHSPDAGGRRFRLKYWSPANAPVLDERSGRAVGVVHQVEDVTAIWAPALGLAEASTRPVRADLDLVDLLGRADLAEVVRNLEAVHARLVGEQAQLTEAFRSRIDIERAVGIVMARGGCDPDEAFETLRRAARDSRTPLHEVATVLVRAVQRRPHRPGGAP